MRFKCKQKVQMVYMTELEKMMRAKTYIDKLANGIDPLTDCEVPDDKVLNNVRISRCLFYVSDILSKVIENGGEVGKKQIVKQSPFFITNEQLEKVEVSEQGVGVQVISKRINDVIGDNVKKCSAVHISSWLLNEGYLSEITRADKRVKIATDKGMSLGIKTVDSVSLTGISYKKNVYNSDAQRFVISNIMNIEKFALENN